MARPEYIEKSKRKQLFRNTLADPENGIRDHALLRFLFGSFIKSIELIRLKTGFIVNEKGLVEPNEDLAIPPELSFNGKQRPMPILNPILIDALQKWIDWRIENNWGVTNTGFIDIHSPLFMSKKNKPFSISTTRQGDVVKNNCESLNRILRRRMQLNGITGTIDSASRTLTLDMYRDGRSLLAIWKLRGDASLETAKAIVSKDPVRLGALVEQIY